MGRYSSVEVEDLVFIVAFESYSPEIAALFLDTDVVARSEWDWEPDGNAYLRDTSAYETTARGMRERLIALGVDLSASEQAVKASWLKRAVSASNPIMDVESMVSDWNLERATALPTAWDRPARDDIQEVFSTFASDDADTLSCLRFLVERIPSDAIVRFDMSQVWGLHGQVRTRTFCADARAQVLAVAQHSAPTIVLTEGSSDAEILSVAVEILRPHLVGFLTFMDYSGKPEGGVDAVVKGIRAFAAAGVANRVIGLLDNDLAGADGVRNITESALPERMKVLLLPETLLTKNYPTLGTDGKKYRDINGLAVSIELFLGEDVLRDRAGDLRPVQLRSYIGKHKAYQGSITEKEAVKKAFFAKAKRAKSGPINRADWADLDFLLDSILAAI